jgi:hypothetical protein
MIKNSCKYNDSHIEWDHLEVDYRPRGAPLSKSSLNFVPMLRPLLQVKVLFLGRELGVDTRTQVAKLNSLD